MSLWTGHSQGIISEKGKETYQNAVDEERKRPSLQQNKRSLDANKGEKQKMHSQIDYRILKVGYSLIIVIIITYQQQFNTGLNKKINELNHHSNRYNPMYSLIKPNAVAISKCGRVNADRQDIICRQCVRLFNTQQDERTAL